MDVRILSQTVRNFGGCDKHSVYKATLRIESLKNLAFKKKNNKHESRGGEKELCSWRGKNPREKFKVRDCSRGGEAPGEVSHKHNENHCS